MEIAANLGTQSLLLFATTVLVVNATPGADMLLTFTNTMRHRVSGGLATALGISAGSLVHTLWVVLGVAALLAASPGAFRVFQWLGAAYLVWIALGLVRDGLREPVRQEATPAEVAELGAVPGFTHPLGALAANDAYVSGDRATPPAKSTSAWQLLLQGLMTNVLNPKVMLFFMALLPQFIAPQTTNKTPALIFLGAWFAVQGFAFLAVFVLLVSGMRRWQPTPARRKALYWLAAAALALVALQLVLVAPT